MASRSTDASELASVSVPFSDRAMMFVSSAMKEISSAGGSAIWSDELVMLAFRRISPIEAEKERPVRHMLIQTTDDLCAVQMLTDSGFDVCSGW